MRLNQKYTIFRNIFSKLIFIISLISSYLIGVTHFDITSSLDWNKYEQYLTLFTYDNVYLTESQGVLYFFIITIFTTIQESIVGPFNQLQALNNGVQLANFFLYSIGLHGIYKLFQSYKVSQENSLIVLSILNFFPPAFYLRLTMKPEIFAFCLLPFAILLTKRIIFNKNILESSLLAALLAIIFSTKGSIIGMTALMFALLFWRDFKNLINNKTLIFLTAFFTLLLNYENYLITNKFIFQNLVTSNYLNKAELEFFYFVDLKLLFTDPYKHLHSNSLLSIILLDTFNDYFDFFWDNDEGYFIQNRIVFFKNFFIQNYLREYLGIFLTIIVYFLFFKGIISKTKYKNYFILPFIGYFILIVNSLGFPSRNFDPQTADTFKVHYIAFLLAISFVFLLVELMEKTKMYKYFFIFLMPIFLFFMGFPKSYDTLLTQQVVNKFNHSEFCYLSIDQSKNCRSKKLNTCISNPALYKIDYESKIRTIPSQSSYFIPVQLEKNGNISYSRNKEECFRLLDEGYEFKSNRNFKILPNKIPSINVSILILVILTSVLNFFRTKKFD